MSEDKRKSTDYAAMERPIFEAWKDAGYFQRTPGFGDTNWRDVFTILHLGGYAGDICVEGYHDPVYRGEWETTAQKHALSYLKWCRGGDYIPNPWDQK